MRNVVMTQEAIEQIEELFQLNTEALDLLSYVVSEWKSDPQSVQCFDLRLVQKAIRVMARIEELDPLRKTAARPAPAGAKEEA